MKLNGKQYDKFILNGKTYEKFYLNNKIYQSLDPGLILDLPLQNNFTDYSASGISMVAGNANGFPNFVSDGSGGYALDFNGTKSIKTAVNLPINTSDKFYIEFDMKTTATGVQAILELSNSFDLNNAFGLFLNTTLSKLALHDSAGANKYNVIKSSIGVNTGSWINIVIQVDRALGINQNKIFINKVLSFVNDSPLTDNNGNYGSYPLFIGQRNGSSLGFVGQMKNLKIYNYPIL